MGLLDKLKKGADSDIDKAPSKSNYSCDAFLSKQVNKELEASLFYQSCQNWCDKKGFIKASTFYGNQAAEERNHSVKVLEFMQGRDIEFTGYDINFTNPKFTDLVDVIKNSLELEIGNTKSLSELYVHSQDDKDYLIQAFALQMLDEQIEEEKTFKDLQAIAEGLKTDNKLDMLHLDEYFN